MASTSQPVKKFENSVRVCHENNSINWSRSSRNKKKLNQSSSTCYKITDFYSSKDLTTVLKENAKLKLQIENLKAKESSPNNSLENNDLHNKSSLL